MNATSEAGSFICGQDNWRNFSANICILLSPITSARNFLAIFTQFGDQTKEQAGISQNGPTAELAIKFYIYLRLVFLRASF